MPVTAPGALKHEGSVWELCFDPLGKWLASSNQSPGARVKLWKTGGWSLLAQSEELPDSTYAMACGGRGKRFDTADSKARVALWQTEPVRKLSETINVTQGELNVWSVAMTDTPFWIFSGNSDGKVWRWAGTPPLRPAAG
jgi:WD40 repeat protein